MALTRVTKTRALEVNGKITQLTREGGGHKVHHRHWMDYNNVGDGTYAGYVLLCPAHPNPGNVNVDAHEVSGKIRWSRGGTGSGNRGGMMEVFAKTAYHNDTLTVTLVEQSDYYQGQYKVTYNGTVYLALKFGQTGGGAHNGVYFDGYTQGSDVPLIMVRDIDVTNATAYGGAYADKAAIHIAATDRVQRVAMLNQPFFDGAFGTAGAQSLNTPITITQTSANGITRNASNNRLTVPMEGYYLIHASQLAQPTNGTYAYLCLDVNGNTKYHAHENFYSESNKDFQVTKILHLLPNDYIEFVWKHGNTIANSWTGSHSTVSVHKLG